MRAIALIFLALTRCLVEPLNIKDFVPSQGAAEDMNVNPLEHAEAPGNDQGPAHAENVPEEEQPVGVPDISHHAEDAPDVARPEKERAYDVIPPLELQAASYSGEYSSKNGSDGASDEPLGESKDSHSQVEPSMVPVEPKMPTDPSVENVEPPASSTEPPMEAHGSLLRGISSGLCAFKLSKETIECALEADRAIREAELKVRELAKDYQEALSNTRGVCEALSKVLQCYHGYCADYNETTTKIAELRAKQTCRIQPILLEEFRAVIKRMENREMRDEFKSATEEFEAAVDNYVDGITKYNEVYKATAHQSLSSAIKSMEVVRDRLKEEAEKNVEVKVLQEYIDMGIQVSVSATDALLTLLDKLLDF